MLSLSIVRAKCYLVLQGLERSLADNLVRNYNIEEHGFLNKEEQNRALVRLREDFEESGWSLEDLRNEDLLAYLDLGDLIQLLNRHKATVRNAKLSDVEEAAREIQDMGIIAIRKRVMHPIRPLEADDLSTLLSIPIRLQGKAPSLTWDHLSEGARLAQSPDNLVDVTLPGFWVEQESITHNLPPPEFDDTGFIGRRAERRQLKTLLNSDHSVITIVGAGGIGKTALALRVCHDILEDPESNLERIVWVSLKTQFLTADGIRTISDSIDTTDALLNRLLSSINLSADNNEQPDWTRVLEQMRAKRTLLVVDNLETLGSQIRELAINIPRDSKLLLTSRVGLGEIELRYDMPDLSTSDSVSLMRHLGVAYNYTTVKEKNERALRYYCRRLHFNPLLIKWFVQAVGKGTRPEDILSNNDLGQALRFCWENVFGGLSKLPIEIIYTLQAARRSLSQTQLQELVGAEHIPFVQAMLELHRSNIVDRNLGQDGGEVYQIGSLVFDYLSRHHPPVNSVVISTREKLRQWQIEQDRSAFQQNTYRYNRKLIHIESNDHRISAPHLRNALQSMGDGDPGSAHKSLERARDLTPQWSEVYRIKARILEMEERPIYEVEQAYEESLLCGANDINRFHYATFLMRNGEFGRALEHIESAMQLQGMDEISFRSIKGQVLLRSGQIPPALEELEYVWNCEGNHVPVNVKRVHGTQFAEALRRRVEQLNSLGNVSEAEQVTLHGIGVVNSAAVTCGWDRKLVEVGLDLLLAGTARVDSGSGTPTANRNSSFSKTFAEWESDVRLKLAIGNHRHSQYLLDLVKTHLGIAENPAVTFGGSGQPKRHTGTIKTKRDHFGFIQTDTVGDVHMNPSSLVHPSEWGELQDEQQVIFSLTYGGRGPHAFQLEILR